MIRIINGEQIYGIDVDEQTRCAHWHSLVDIIAIKFKCCGRWFPCYDCHTAIAGHAAITWPAAETDAKAILCGACGSTLTIAEYFDCGSACPACGSLFNPRCILHKHLYFAS